MQGSNLSRFRNISVFLLVLVGALTATSLFAEEAVKSSTLAIKPGPPAGFEEFSGPRETSIDLFYGGLKIGSFHAVYTDKFIAFSDPKDIVSKIPAIKPEESDRLTQVLTGDLQTHADLVCNHARIEGCGNLQPDTASIIFDEDRFKADLFINPKMLALQDTHKDKILPPAPDILSAIQALNGSITGSPGEKQNYSMLTNSTIAYGASRVNLVSIASNKEKQINSMSASLDKWGLENKIGLFDSHPLQLLPQTPMTGISVGTSLNTNLALRNTEGSRLTIFLAQRSYVSLIYNNVIYTTDFYEAGNQVLNTDSLPEGAYEVTIRIRDTAGAQTEEKRFFTKHFEIPPSDQPIFFGQIGSIRDVTSQGTLPNAGHGVVASAGTLRRLGESTGFDVDMLAVKNTIFAESGAFLLLPPDHQLRASALLSSAQDIGFGINYLGYALDKKLAFSTDLRSIFQAKEPIATDSVNPINGSSKQMAMNASYQLSDLANVGVQANYSKASTSRDNYSYGPLVRWDLWREGDSNLSLSGDSSMTQNGTVHSVMLRFTKRLGSWGLSTDGGLRGGEKAAAGGRSLSRSGDARITWNNDKSPGTYTVVGAETRHDESSDGYIVDMDHRGHYGNIKMLGSQTHTPQGQNTFYSGNFGVSIGQTGSDIAMSGNQQQDSGIIVKTTGDSKEIPMKIMVNRSERTTFETGGSAAVFLPPYQTYNVSISPVNSAAIDYDGMVKNVTLYPGNMVPLVWNVNPIHVVLGHVVLEDGSPLANARLEEARNITITGEDGLFQAELLSVESITFNRAAEEPPFFKANMDTRNRENEIDIFSALPPETTSHKLHRSKMSEQDQKEAIIGLFGDEDNAEQDTGLAGSKDEPTAKKEDSSLSEPKQSNVVPENVPLIHKLLPALRCRVSLPHEKEENNIVIYDEPLICHEIPFDDTQQNTSEVKKSDLMKGTVDAGEPDSTNSADWMYQNTVEKPVEINRSNTDLLQQNNQTSDQNQASQSSASVIADPKKSTEDGENESIHNANNEDISNKSQKHFEAQFAAYQNEMQANEALEKLFKDNPDFATKTVHIVKADLGSMGIYYRIRGEFETSEEAVNICKTFHSQGKDCFVVPQKSSTDSSPASHVALEPPNRHKHSRSQKSVLSVPKELALPEPPSELDH